MLDTSIQMMFSTVITSIIAGLLLFYKSGMSVNDITSYIKIYTRFKSHNPLEFNPSIAPVLKTKGLTSSTNQLFRYSFNKNEEYALRWFVKYHLNKPYIIPNGDYTNGIDVKSKDMFCNDAYLNGNIEKIFESANDISFPVWYDTSGYWCHMIFPTKYSINDYVRIESYSLTAVNNCIASIYSLKDTIETHISLLKKNEYKIHKVVPDDSKNCNLKFLGLTSSNKTFRSLFFERKEYILSVLEKFKNKTLFPKHVPIDNKLGIILHGTPGTGKTGFITALANYLERDVVIINMNKIKTCAQMDFVFENAKNKVLVFEEIDCMESLRKRGGVVSGEVNNNSNALMDMKDMMVMMALSSNTTANNNTSAPPPAVAVGSNAPPQTTSRENSAFGNLITDEINTKKDILDLGYILSKLDGIESGDGRIIVATTNHIEMLDPAILRPGRFGIHLHFKNTTRENLCKIINMFYETNLTVEDLATYEDYKWSPAEILQYCIIYTDPRELIQFLSTHSPKLDLIYHTIG